MDELLDANRANWDDRTPVHLASRFYDIDGWLARAPGPRDTELVALGDVAGRTLVHLQCHVGTDTLAFARAGATVTGLDFSPVAIEAAVDLAARAGLADQSTFVCADVHDAVEALGRATFDIVYVSLGALCWIPKIDDWAAQAAQLVAPGGVFYLHDVHPLAWALDDAGERFEHSCFEEEVPFSFLATNTYTGGRDNSVAPREVHEWNHGLGEIVTALVRHGLRIDSVVEHDWTHFAQFPWLVQRDGDGMRWFVPADHPRVPLSFTVVATKTADPAAS